MAENVFKVIGIKQVSSKDRSRVYTSYYCMKNFSAHALFGRTFGCVPGANQYANLLPFLGAMK